MMLKKIFVLLDIRGGSMIWKGIFLIEDFIGILFNKINKKVIIKR